VFTKTEQEPEKKSSNLNKFHFNISSTSTNKLSIYFDQNNNGLHIGLKKRPELDIDSLNSFLELALGSMKLKFNNLENNQAKKSFLARLQQFIESD